MPKRTRGICTVESCEKPNYAKKMCKDHYYRVRKFGRTDLLPTYTVEERLWAKTNKTDSCWLWTAGTQYGYGVLQVDLLPRRVHRLSYEMHYGPIPEGMFIDHKCRVKLCLNPEHLRLATPKQNTENKSKSPSATGIRGVFPYPARGKYMVRVWSDKKSYYGGYFKDLKEAEAAAIALRLKLHTHNIFDREGV